MYLHLSQVNEIAVDRLVLAKGQPIEIQLHGLCDYREGLWSMFVLALCESARGSNN